MRDADARVESLNERIHALQAENALLNKKSADLEAENAVLNKRASDLESEISKRKVALLNFGIDAHEQGTFPTEQDAQNDAISHDFSPRSREVSPLKYERGDEVPLDDGLSHNEVPSLSEPNPHPRDDADAPVAPHVQQNVRRSERIRVQNQKKVKSYIWEEEEGRNRLMVTGEF